MSKKKINIENMSAAEIREHRLNILYKVLPIISILLLIGLWLFASSLSSGFPSPGDVWERTVRLFTKPVKKMNLFGSDPKSLYLLDQELASRTYTAPSLVL